MSEKVLGVTELAAMIGKGMSLDQFGKFLRLFDPQKYNIDELWRLKAANDFNVTNRPKIFKSWLKYYKYLNRFTSAKVLRLSDSQISEVPINAVSYSINTIARRSSIITKINKSFELETYGLLGEFEKEEYDFSPYFKMVRIINISADLNAVTDVVEFGDEGEKIKFVPLSDDYNPIKFFVHSESCLAILLNNGKLAIFRSWSGDVKPEVEIKYGKVIYSRKYSSGEEYFGIDVIEFKSEISKFGHNIIVLSNGTVIKIFTQSHDEKTKKSHTFICSPILGLENAFDGYKFANLIWWNGEIFETSNIIYRGDGQSSDKIYYVDRINKLSIHNLPMSMNIKKILIDERRTQIGAINSVIIYVQDNNENVYVCEITDYKTDPNVKIKYITKGILTVNYDDGTLPSIFIPQKYVDANGKVEISVAGAPAVKIDLDKIKGEYWESPIDDNLSLYISQKLLTLNWAKTVTNTFPSGDERDSNTVFITERKY